MVTERQKVPLAQFDASMSIEQMAQNLMTALQRAGFKTPPVERVLERYRAGTNAGRSIRAAPETHDPDTSVSKLPRADRRGDLGHRTDGS